MAYDPNLGYDPSNIAKSINEAAARGDDAEVERLSVARYQTKVQGNPSMSQYENDPYSVVAKNALKRQGEQTGVVDTGDTTTGTTTTGSDTTQKSFPEMMQWIDALSAQQKAGAIAGLDASRQSALSSLGSERTALTPAYAAQRQQIAATGDVEAQRMNEFLATQGLARSGAAGELQGRVGAQTTGQLAQARQSEQSALQDILRRQSDVEAQYQIGLQNANSAAEVSRIQNLIDQARADRNYELQAAGYTGMLGGQQTMQGAQHQRETQAAALQTQLDTMGRYSNDYAAEINARTASPDKADDALIPYLTTARNAKVAAQQAAQSESSQAQYKEAMDMFKTLGTASGWVAKALGLPEGATTREYLKTVYDVSRPYYKATSGATDKSIAGMGTESQVAEYYDTLNSYVTGTVGANDPEAAYDAALGVKGDLVKIMGEKLTTQLLADLKSRATTVGQPAAEPTEKTIVENPYYKAGRSYIASISTNDAGREPAEIADMAFEWLNAQDLDQPTKDAIWASWSLE